MTTRASSSSPLSSTTPVARPLSRRTRATGASVRIVAPCARADDAIASETAPLPPLQKPQARKAPSISPM